jgi:capsular exopolysaccharide synthesis family protein
MNTNDESMMNRRTSLVAASAGAPQQLGNVGRHRLPYAVGNQAASSTSISPQFLWWTLRQWSFIVIPAGLILAAAAAAVVILTYTPSYQASTLIKIKDMKPSVIFGSEGNTGETPRYVETQVELLRSPVVLEPVLALPNIAAAEEISRAADRFAYLQKHVTVSRIGQSELYNVSYESTSPTDAAAIANAIVAQFLEENEKDESERFVRVGELLEEQRLDRKERVTQQREKVTNLSKGILSKEIASGDSFGLGSSLDPARATSPYASIYQELTRIEVDRAVVEANIRSLEETSDLANQAESSGLIELKIDGNPTVMSLQTAIDAVLLKAEEYKSTLRSGADVSKEGPYQRLLQEQTQQQAALKQMREKVRALAVAELVEERKARREESLEKCRQELSQLDSRKVALEAKLAKESTGLKNENKKAIDLAFARAELEREEKILDMIEGRKLAIQTENRAPARVTTMRKATAPTAPISPLPYKLLFLSCAAALVAPFGLAVLREMSVRRISDVEQMSREARLSVLGEVAQFPVRKVAANAGLLPAKLQRQMFLYLDSIDSLRTNVELLKQDKDLGVLVVTSAAAGEGKTCLATSLTMSLAKANQRPTLIIDCDLRSPDVATVLSVRQKPGLAEVLNQQAMVSDVIQQVGNTQAFVIPAGKLKGNPHHLLREERLGPILEQLRGQFATIVIDTPPVFGGSESLTLAKMADATIISAMCNVSRSRQVTMVIDRLERVGATILGAALNGKQALSYANYYGYGSYSGRLEAGSTFGT